MRTFTGAYFHILMKKPWQEHLFFIKGYRKHHTGATEGNIHTVNSTGWATGATICKPSKHMSSYEWQQQKNGSLQLCSNICDFSGMKRTHFTKSCLLHWLTDDMTYDRLHVYELKNGNHSVSAALNIGVIRLQNTNNMINNNIYRTRPISWAWSKINCIIRIHQYFPVLNCFC